MTKNSALTLFLFLFLTQLSFTQTILDAFSLSENNGNVVINWTISKGNTCNGIDILRSSDSLNFIEIGDIEGVCGDTDRTVSYTYTDEDPLYNRKNHYRLQLGTVETTQILSITLYSYGSKGYFILPNPAYNEAAIHFENAKGTKHELYVYNIQGHLVRKEIGTQSFFVVRKNELSSGMYVFTLREGNSSNFTSGKIIVQN